MAVTIEYGQGKFEQDGHTFHWSLQLLVSSPKLGLKSTQLGGSQPEKLAILLADELIQEHAKR